MQTGNSIRSSFVFRAAEKLFLGLRWRIKPHLYNLYLLSLRARISLAALYRRLFLRRVVFIGITGSVGKTTTKEMLVKVLSSEFRGHGSIGNGNYPKEAAETIFRVRPWDRFCVQEVSVGVKGQPVLEQTVRMLRPQIGVVTNVGEDHLSAFGTKEKIAEEKGKLIAGLSPRGTAILNADDANVMSMRNRFNGRVITFGLSADADIRAENINYRWPERLSFTVHYGGQSQVIQTQLLGTHWTHSVIAAIAAGIAMDLPLPAIAEAVRVAEPYYDRLSPVEHPSGVTFIRDDFKAPIWTVPPALAVLKSARANRKIVVIGTLSDIRGDAAGKYVNVARQAVESADYVFFVGKWASRCLRARRNPQDDTLRAFSNVEEISLFLNGFLQPGDLVLLKGRKGLDDLVNIIEYCPDSLSTAPMQNAAAPAAHDEVGEQRSRQSIGSLPATASEKGPHDVQVVVGLGNPGEEYENTRHNIGQRVVDLIANAYGAKWQPEEQAMVAEIERQQGTLYLLKPLTMVNLTGEALLHLAERLHFNPTQCTLVYDDLDLPSGKVRQRIKGGPGGHNGIRSILHAFQSEDFPRIKVGIGRPANKDQITQYVLGAFSDAERPAIEHACKEAASMIVGPGDDTRRLVS